MQQKVWRFQYLGQFYRLYRSFVQYIFAQLSSCQQINSQFIFKTDPNFVLSHHINFFALIGTSGNTDPDSRKFHILTLPTQRPNPANTFLFFTLISFPFPRPSKLSPSRDYKKICHHLTKQFLFMRSYIYPTNNFGNHNNTHFYFYSRSVTQGNNWSSYGLHQVEIVNDSDSNIEVVGWTMKEGRVEEDFKTNVVRPGLFYTARLVPNSWGTYKSIIGALTVKVQGTNQFYTIAFEDPFHDYVNKGYKGHIEEGNNPNRAISSLKDHNAKTQPWGRYEFAEFDGRGKTVFTITNKGR